MSERWGAVRVARAPPSGGELAVDGSCTLALGCHGLTPPMCARDHLLLCPVKTSSLKGQSSCSTRERVSTTPQRGQAWRRAAFPGLLGPALLGGRPRFPAMQRPHWSLRVPEPGKHIAPYFCSRGLLSVVRSQGSARPGCTTVFLKIGPSLLYPSGPPSSLARAPTLPLALTKEGLAPPRAETQGGFTKLVSLYKRKWAVAEELG